MTEATSLDKAAILATAGKRNMARELVCVPQWNGSVWARAMTSRERDAFEQSNLKEDFSGELQFQHDGYRARLGASTMCDAEGNLLFTPADVAQLDELDSDAIDRVLKVAKRLNGMNKSDVEKTAKNSSGGRSDASGSGSPDSGTAPSEKPSSDATEANSPSGGPST